jgi:hypothetical protein
VACLLVLFVVWWFVAGRPVDWPWNWNNYLFGRSTVNKFLTSVEKNDLQTAYGIWIHDKNWQQHPTQSGAYPFSRFQQDWSSTSPAILMNGRKSKALNLEYDPKTSTLDFAPPGVELYLGP